MTIYFDTAASYPLLPTVETAMHHAFKEMYANPSSQHKLGEQAAGGVEACRKKVAEALGALPSEIIFTSGATESNNLALKGHISSVSDSGPKHIVVSTVEHKCIHAIVEHLVRACGVTASFVAPDKHGIISPEAIRSVITNETSLVSIMHVNNEIGSVNCLSDIGQLCFENGIKFHTDAAQSFLKATINVDTMNLDYASISAHKIGGPKGVGALYIRDQRNSHIEPIIHGAGQENGLRGGTLAAPLMIGFDEAISRFPAVYSALVIKNLKSYLVDCLTKQGLVFTVNGESIPSLVSLTLPNSDIAGLLRNSDGILALATGSACSSKEIEASHVLSAIGIDRDQASKTLRISFHHEHTRADIDQLVSWIKKFS